jgi:hypothetical protein
MAKRYTRVCNTCGREDKVTYSNVLGRDCMSCAKKKAMVSIVAKRNANRIYIKYWYICPHCPNVRITRTKRKTNRCASCSRNKAKTYIQYFIKFDFNTMSYIKVLNHLPRPKVNRVKKSKAIKKLDKPIRKKSIKVSKEAIERERLRNRKHKLAIAEQKNKPKKPKKTDEEMIAEFLAKKV